MVEEDVWRKRFYLFMGLRLFGVLVFLAGFAIAFTSLARPGGWPAVGAIVIILGVIDAVVAPRLLRKRWREEDRAAGKE
jgi:membrane protein implicated in regulation of membrane protease activity